VLVRLRQEVQEVSRSLVATALLILATCQPAGTATTATPTIAPIVKASLSPSPTPSVLDDRFGLLVGDGNALSVRSETSDVVLTSFPSEGRSWTSLSHSISPDGRSIAYWAPVRNGPVLHVRSLMTGSDRAVFTGAPDMSGNAFSWSTDGTGLAVAIDNDCQEICAVHGGRAVQELWTVDLASGSTEKIASGKFWLPITWDRSAKLIAAGVTGPGGYLVGYDLIGLAQRPYPVRATPYQPATIGKHQVSSDGRYVLLFENGASSNHLSWWPTGEPQTRQDVAFDGSVAEWRPATSEIWWVGGLVPAGCAAPPCRGRTLVSVDVVTGARKSLSGSFGGSIVGFRVDGSAAMTWDRNVDSLIVVDVRSGQTATLRLGGPFVRVR